MPGDMANRDRLLFQRKLPSLLVFNSKPDVREEVRQRQACRFLIPDILPFVVRDYDSHFGFDGLAARNRDLSRTEVTHLFVEFKVELRDEFNHSFEKLDTEVL